MNFYPRDKKAIALYFQSLSRKGGGAEKMLCLLANELSEKGYKVHIFSWDSKNAQSFYHISKEVIWHKLDFHQGIIDKFRRVIELRNIFLRHQISVMIGFVMSGDLTVYLAAITSNVRIISAERNAPSMYKYLYKPFRRWLNLNLLRLSDKIIVQNHNFIKGYPSYLHKKIEVIPNPVNIPGLISDPKGSESTKKIILCVGRLESVQKRPELLLEAFAKISDTFDDWNLFFLGDGDIKDRMISRIKELKLESKIFIFSTSNNISSFYEKAQLYAMPSAWEGFPNSLAEAMSYGLPAIGFEESQGVTSLVSQSNGWLAKGLNSSKELSSALTEAMGNSDKRIQKGFLARKTIEKFNPKKIFSIWQITINKTQKRSDYKIPFESNLEFLENKEMPLITVGISVYNAQDTIKFVLDSVNSQSWPNFETVIVDDCSTDQSYEILKSWVKADPKKRRLYKLDKNSGVAVVRNRIIKEARGEFLAFFDDDDISNAERLFLQWSRIINYEKKFSKGSPVICHTSRTQFYPRGKTRIESTMGQNTLEIAPNGISVVERILLGKPVKNAYGSCATCSQMARTLSYKLVGGFDSNLRRSEDTDIVIRLAMKGAHFIGISDPLVSQIMTFTPDKTSNDEYDNMLKIITKHKSFINQYGNFNFSLKWLKLKYEINKSSKIFFLMRLFKIFLIHPIYTSQRVIMALPGVLKK